MGKVVLNRNFRAACELVCAGLSASLLLNACATPTLERQALDAGMTVSQAQGTSFQHRLFTLAGDVAGDAADGPLIVLLDGDGRAFLDRHTVADDPTPRHSWLLDLTPELSGIGSVAYVGRPCYHQLSDPACGPQWWTVARYGSDVAASLAGVIAAQRKPGQRLLLVGYSGGGVLALLVAAQLTPAPIGVVTIAAPLDVAAWSSYHGYTPLVASEDPADDPGRYRRLCRRHLFGSRDRVVPPALISQWRWPLNQTETLVDTGHHGAWRQPTRDAVTGLLDACTGHLERQGAGG